MIEALSGFPSGVLAFTCRGRVTRRDYEAVLIPAVEAALKVHRRLRLYYQVGPGFEAIEPGAILDDFLVGVEHLTRWERLALVSDVEWIRTTARLFGFLLPGRLRIFHLDDAAAAQAWIEEAG